MVVKIFSSINQTEVWHIGMILYHLTGLHYFNRMVILPKGSIKKLIGRDLTWQDEPVELKEE